MKKFRYVVLGSADKYIERGFVYLEWVTIAVLIFAAIIFAPAIIHIFWG